MAGNKEIVDFTLLSAPIGSEVYGVKSDTDYRVAVGSALGLATLGADGKLDAAQVPAGSGGTVTSVGLTVGTGISLTGSSPITTSGTWALALSANLQAWSSLATSAKADTVHAHAASDVTSGTFAAARLGSGTADSTKYLRGDLTWQTYSGGGGGGSGTVTSVDITGSTGITPSGGPVTTSGSITLTLSANLQAWSALATSAKANASHTHAASDITSGVLGTARLGTGTADSTKWLRGDGTWQTIASGSGTVTSVEFSGGTTGLSASGGPITTSGTFTMGGVLVVANGGTGASSLTGYVKGAGTSALTASATIPGSDISGNISGSAATWTTARTLTIGSTGKSVNGSGNVTWTVAEVGAVANGGSLATATKLTQAAYNALGTPDASTLYIIVG